MHWFIFKLFDILMLESNIQLQSKWMWLSTNNAQLFFNVKVASKCSVPPLDHLARYCGMVTIFARHPSTWHTFKLSIHDHSYVCIITLYNRTRLPVGAGSFNIMWWGYKYMFPLDGGSKILSSWMGVAKMLTFFYWVSVTPLGINNCHPLSSNFQIFLALCKYETKT